MADTKKRIRMETGSDGSKEGHIDLYDSIGDYWDGMSAKDLRDELKALGPLDKIHLHVNSLGGDLLHGIAMHSTLKAHPAKVQVHVEGIAASAASLVAMAGDTIEMSPGSFMMVHNPAMGSYGDSDDLSHDADVLQKFEDSIAGIYSARTGQPVDKVQELMDEESWLTAEEAVDLGFADCINDCGPVSNLAVFARVDPGRYQKLPNSLRSFFMGKPATEPNVTDQPNPKTSAAAAPAAAAGTDAAAVASPGAAAATRPAAAAAATEPAAAASVTEPAAAAPAKIGPDFLAAFGDQGGVWFAQGKSWDEAQLLYTQSLRAQVQKLEKQVAAASFGQADAVSAGDADRDNSSGATAKNAVNARLGGNLNRIAAGIVLPKPSNN